MNFISSLRSAVTQYGKGRFAAGKRSRLGCGMVRLDQRRSPLRLAKSHSASFRAFGIRTGKRCLSTATSAPQTRQVRGRRLGFLGLGPNRVYVKTTADRAKITLARTERPCDPDDAITWQSLGGIGSFRTSLYFS